MLRSCLLAALFLTAASTVAPAHAKPKRRLQPEPSIVSIERVLLPDAIADRIEGSGVTCRSIASVLGSRHTVHIASVRINIGKTFAVRGGVGMAAQTPSPFAPEESGMAASGSVIYSLWRTDGYSLDIDVAGMHSGYRSGSLTDATALLVFRNQ